MGKRIWSPGCGRKSMMSVFVLAFAALCSDSAQGRTLEVGPGRQFARIEEATAQAHPGDLILVHPREGDQPYEQTAVLVRQKGITFRAQPALGARWVKISGKGFQYTGAGSTPRAVFQFNRGADDCVLEGFELCSAHNDSHNGAGVRINQANHVTIRNCSIHHNDMGIMSNGDETPEVARDQRIEHCEIHHNGDRADPGYNHNLYLGGTSVTVRFCEIHSSLTGHNVKSRAHQTRVEYCYVHDSRNREFDLVDAADTARPESHAVLLANLIVKDSKCTGNRGVLHFGQDGGRPHDGTAYLLFNTIVSPFLSPVLDLSASGAKAHLVGNLIADGELRQNGQKIASTRNGARLADVTGQHNWFSGDFGGVNATGLAPKTNQFRRAQVRLFVAPVQHDYHLTGQAAELAAIPLSLDRLELPRLPGKTDAENDPPPVWQYRHPAGKERRPVEKRLTLGAFALPLNRLDAGAALPDARQ